MSDAKVTVHDQPDAPPAAVAATAVASVNPGTAVDAKGRSITVAPLDPVQVYRLSKVLGVGADTEFTRNYAAFAACVRKIDGESIPFPTNELQIEAIMQRLGSDGLEAVNKALTSLESAKSDRNTTPEKN